MKKISVDKIEICDSINNLLNYLIDNEFEILEITIEDYHFHQIYIKTRGNINSIHIEKFKDLIINEHKISCNCHWSTVEIKNESVDILE